MLNLKTTTDGDIDFSNGYISFIDGNESVLAHIKSRLSFAKGQFIIYPESGVPYFQFILGTKNITVASELIKNIIKDTPDVLLIQEFKYEFDNSQRNLQLTFKIKTVFGEISDNVNLLI